MNVRSLLIPTALTLGSMLVAGDLRSAARQGIRSALGVDTVSLNERAPARKFPLLRSTAQIPSTIDPHESGIIGHSCSIRTLQVNGSGDITGVKNVKGRYSTTLYVLEPMSGTFQDTEVATGKFKTDAEGRAAYEAPVPTELLFDAFESGTASVWTSTTITLTSTRKINLAQNSCSMTDLGVMVTPTTD